jgi:acetyl-CoA carboxylase biotin carboxylase subunit
MTTLDTDTLDMVLSTLHEYTTEFCRRPLLAPRASEREQRDLAVAAAIAYASRNLAFRPSTPERATSGWHRESRRLPS